MSSASPSSTGTTRTPGPPAGMQGTPGPLLSVVRDQRLAFLLVGGFNTAVGTACFALFRVLLPSLPDVVVLLMAHVVSIPTAFFFYRYLVFRVRGHVLRDLWRFELVNLGTFAVNLVLLPFIRWTTGIASIPAQIIATVVIAVVAYVGHRGFSFRRPPDDLATDRGTVAAGLDEPSGVPAPPPGPLVSIVIPAYNNADFIAATMDTVLAQTYPHLEVVVADHASSDSTWAVLERYAGDPRVRLLRTPAGGGAKANWDRVSREARGRWVKLVCGDDLLRPTCVAEQVEAAQANPGAVMVASRRDVVDANGAVVVRDRGLAGLRGLVEGRVAVRHTVRAGTNVFGEPACVLLRRDVLEEVGWWDDSEGTNGYYIDAATYTRVLAHGDLVAHGRTLAGFRVNAGQWSVRLAGQQAAQAAAFHASVLERDPSLVNRADVAVGDSRALLLSLARRGTYVLLRRRMG